MTEGGGFDPKRKLFEILVEPIFEHIKSQLEGRTLELLPRRWLFEVIKNSFGDRVQTALDELRDSLEKLLGERLGRDVKLVPVEVEYDSLLMTVAVDYDVASLEGERLGNVIVYNDFEHGEGKNLDICLNLAERAEVELESGEAERKSVQYDIEQRLGRTVKIADTYELVIELFMRFGDRLREFFNQLGKRYIYEELRFLRAAYEGPVELDLMMVNFSPESLGVRATYVFRAGSEGQTQLVGSISVEGSFRLEDWKLMYKVYSVRYKYRERG